MKALIFLCVLAFLTFSQTIQSPQKVDSTCLSHSLYKGHIVDGLKWNDKSGKHIIIITQYKKGQTLEKGWISELYAYKFDIVNTTFKQVWKIQELTPNYYTEVEYMDSSLKIFDIDNKGVAESRFFYGYCYDDDDPFPMKYMFHYHDQKLAIRGKIPMTIDTSEYEKNMDAIYNTVPKNIKEFASKDWDVYVHKQFESFLFYK